jgi:hypothetical protein
LSASSPSLHSGKPSYPPRSTLDPRPGKRDDHAHAPRAPFHPQPHSGDLIADVLGLAVGHTRSAALDAVVGGYENRMHHIEVMTPLGHLLGATPAAQKPGIGLVARPPPRPRSPVPMRSTVTLKTPSEEGRPCALARLDVDTGAAQAGTRPERGAATSTGGGEVAASRD